MKKFIVIRHGSGFNMEEQMLHMAEQLKPHLEGNTVRLITSTAFRADDSAKELARELGLTGYENHAILWSDRDHEQNNRAALALVRKKFEGVDVLIVLTHLEYAEELPTVFGKEVLQTQIEPYELSHGQGRIVLCDEKTASVIS